MVMPACVRYLSRHAVEQKKHLLASVDDGRRQRSGTTYVPHTGIAGHLDAADLPGSRSRGAGRPDRPSMTPSTSRQNARRRRSRG